MAPQQAGNLVWKAGLIARDSAGKPTGWADLQACCPTQPGELLLRFSLLRKAVSNSIHHTSYTDRVSIF